MLQEVLHHTRTMIRTATRFHRDRELGVFIVQTRVRAPWTRQPHQYTSPDRSHHHTCGRSKFPNQHDILANLAIHPASAVIPNIHAQSVGLLCFHARYRTLVSGTGMLACRVGSTSICCFCGCGAEHLAGCSSSSSMAVVSFSTMPAGVSST